MENNLVKSSKIAFNDFFQNYLYGFFGNEENVILSRGSWEDTIVKHPKVFKFALNVTLEKQWSGYSDSLGHDNTFDQLLQYVNLSGEYYKRANLALTLGNVAGLSFVFMHLKKILKTQGVNDAELLSVIPFYPSILDSASNFFDINLLPTYQISEKDIIKQIKAKIDSGLIRVVLIPNLVGVDGRTYSRDFFRELIEYLSAKGIYLIIDEIMWFNPLQYPENIASNHVIRVCSLSKMHGIPGMKLGFMLGSADFVDGFYNTASSGYGGPASLFFLLQEFVYAFERYRIKGDDSLNEDECTIFSKRYGITKEEVNDLYKDYTETIGKNYSLFLHNYNIVRNWAAQNGELFSGMELNTHNPAINTLFEIKTVKDFSFLVSLLFLYKTSIFPGTCIGFPSNNFFRINFLESSKGVQNGLDNISELLSKYKKRVAGNVKMVLLDSSIMSYASNINQLEKILNLKGIELGILNEQGSVTIKSLVNSVKIASGVGLMDKNERHEVYMNVAELLNMLTISPNEVLYLGETSKVKGGGLIEFPGEVLADEGGPPGGPEIDNITKFILNET